MNDLRGILHKDKSEASLSTSLKQLIFGLVLFTFVSFLVATYIITERERRDYSVRNADNVLKTLSSNISSDIDKYKSISRLIMIEQRVVTFLRAKESSVDIGMINDARYGIMDILNATEGVDSVMIFREDMIMVATNRFTYNYDYELMNSDSWRQDIYAALGRPVVSLCSNGVAEKADKRPVVTIGRVINDIYSQKRTGLMMLNMSTIVFERMLLSLGYDNICIMGSDGTYLAGNRDYEGYFEDSFTSEKIVHRSIRRNGEDELLSGCRVKDTPVVILRVSPYGTEGIPYRMLYILLFLLVGFVAMTVFVGIFIRRNITDPVFSLSMAMERNKKSGVLEKIDTKVPYTEFGMLEADYNSMIDHVNELFDKLVEKEKTLQKSEMRVLQEQIKPHFLYNSIETIGFLALDAGAGNVHDALETLGSFYRNFLSKGDKEIPLSREIQIVKDYLSLQKLRYGDILQDEYDISDDTLNIVVPKLILQPIVENCIYHGIRMKGEKGTIKITSRLDNGELHLIVKDTGVGMEQDKIDSIVSSKNKNYEQNADSFGLWGTVERIRYYTGREDVIKIRSEVGEYTEIEFIISDMNRA